MGEKQDHLRVFEYITIVSPELLVSLDGIQGFPKDNHYTSPRDFHFPLQMIPPFPSIIYNSTG